MRERVEDFLGRIHCTIWSYLMYWGSKRVHSNRPVRFRDSWQYKAAKTISNIWYSTKMSDRVLARAEARIIAALEKALKAKENKE